MLRVDDHIGRRGNRGYHYLFLCFPFIFRSLLCFPPTTSQAVTFPVKRPLCTCPIFPFLVVREVSLSSSLDFRTRLFRSPLRSLKLCEASISSWLDHVEYMLFADGSSLALRWTSGRVLFYLCLGLEHILLAVFCMALGHGGFRYVPFHFRCRRLSGPFDRRGHRHPSRPLFIYGISILFT